MWSPGRRAVSLSLVALASTLERGKVAGPMGRALAPMWARHASRALVRRLEGFDGTHVVAIGGATLGGSGKTPLAIACAQALASSGARVALVGHAYRARPGHARAVRHEDTLDDVGDEAILAARELAGAGVIVVVAPRRTEAVAYAAHRSEVIVLDGVAQTAPVRASLALLAVDAHEPWGRTRAVPPLGDLRAPISALRSVSDALVAITDPRIDAVDPSLEGSWPADAHSRGVWSGGRIVPWGDLAGTRVGLVCASARPHRVLRFLEARGLNVRAMIRDPDHGPLRSGACLVRGLADAERQSGVDLWLATAKCAIHLERSRYLTPSLPGVALIDYSLTLGTKLVERLSRLGSP